MKLVVAILIGVAIIVYAYAFSWHDYCIDKKYPNGAGGIACTNEPQIENWWKGS
jgi:hypothetical protein